MGKLIPKFELYKSLRTLDGGEGSGNFGHSGRPGEVGGSGGGGGGQADDTWTRGFMASQGINVSGLMKNYGVRVEVLTKGINRMIEKGEMPFKDEASYKQAKKEVGNLTDETQKKKLQNAINRHDLYQKCKEYMKSNPVVGTSSGEVAKAAAPVPKPNTQPKSTPMTKTTSQPAQPTQPKQETSKQIDPIEVSVTRENLTNAMSNAVKNRNSIPVQQLQPILDTLNEHQYRIDTLKSHGIDMHIDLSPGTKIPQKYDMNYLRNAINNNYGRAVEELRSTYMREGRNTRPLTLQDIKEYVGGQVDELLEGMQDGVNFKTQKELVASWAISNFMYQNMLENARR